MDNAQQNLKLLPKLCKKYSPHDASQHDITDKLVSFVAGDLITLSILAGPRGFAILSLSRHNIKFGLESICRLNY